MVRIAPINLYYNPKTLWFDAGDLDVGAGKKIWEKNAQFWIMQWVTNLMNFTER